jgi:hypothetical protein
MKSMKILAVACTLAVSGMGLASATVYHVSGSTAFRVADVTAEANYLVANFTTVTGAYSGASLTGANTSVITGVSATSTVTFENAFNGSIQGDESVSAVAVPGNAGQVVFPTATGVTLTAVTKGSSTAPASGGNSVTFSNTETTYADIAFSDVSFATAKPVIKLATSATASAQGGSVVGVVPFVFVANATSDITDFGSTVSTSTIVSTSTFTYATATVAVNVTHQNFADLWSNGVLNTNSSSQYDSGANPTVFTGSVTDSSYTIFAAGRDIDSGSRATALAETGYPLKGNGVVAVTQPVSQFFPLDASNNVVGNVGTGTIESFESVPAETVDGISLAAGNGGYNSGGNLAKALSVTIDKTSNPQTVMIGYLGASDAYTALTASGTGRHPAILLGYEGTSFNPAGSSLTNGYAVQADINKVYAGSYTFWSYEHVYYNSNNVTGGLNDSANPSSIVSSLVSQLLTDQVDQLSSAGVEYADMIAARNDDGLQVQ